MLSARSQLIRASARGPATPKASPATTVSTVKAKDLKAWTPLNVTKGNLVESQGGETTRNIDGVVYHISYDKAADEVVVVDRKMGKRFPAAIDENSRVRIDTSAAMPYSVAGFSADAFQPVLRGDSAGAEIINCRAAMVGYLGVLAVELASHQPALAQLASPAGAAAAAAVGLLTLAASIAPAVAGKVPASQVILLESDSFPGRPLPYIWHPLAEKLNGRVAMVGLVGLILVETFARGGAALF